MEPPEKAPTKKVKRRRKNKPKSKKIMGAYVKDGSSDLDYVLATPRCPVNEPGEQLELKIPDNHGESQEFSVKFEENSPQIFDRDSLDESDQWPSREPTSENQEASKVKKKRKRPTKAGPAVSPKANGISEKNISPSKSKLDSKAVGILLQHQSQQSGFSDIYPRQQPSQSREIPSNFGYDSMNNGHQSNVSSLWCLNQGSTPYSDQNFYKTDYSNPRIQSQSAQQRSPLNQNRRPLPHEQIFQSQYAQ